MRSAFIRCVCRPRFFLGLAVLLIGLAHLTILPPFEGFDEIGHYSSIRQIADTGRIPLYGESFIDSFVETYRAKGPMLYNILKPYQDDKNITYEKFASDAQLHPDYAATFRNPLPIPLFSSGAMPNWQAQHPPLYYILAAGVMKATNGLSFVAQFFVLRLFSYLLAFTGLLMGALWFARVAPSGIANETAFRIALCYPFIAPMFFPEFARLGNDSLCLFLLSLALLCLDAWMRDPSRLRGAVGTGIAVGLGLLTKAFFLPIAFGLSVFLYFRYRAVRNDPEKAMAYRDGFSMMIFPVLLGAFWYLYKLEAFGSFSGGADFISLDRQGGLAALIHNVTLYPILRGLIGGFQTWLGWTTASLQVFRGSFFIPVIGFNLWLFVCSLRRLPLFRFDEIAWLPFFILLPVFLGLAGHMTATIALSGNSQTPGWYLNLFAPLFAVYYAIAFRAIFVETRARRILYLFMSYNGLFILANMLFGALLYGGCFAQTDGKIVPIGKTLACFKEIPGLFAALELLGWPVLSLFCLAGGCCALFIAFKLWRREGESLRSVEKAF